MRSDTQVLQTASKYGGKFLDEMATRFPFSPVSTHAGRSQTSTPPSNLSTLCPPAYRPPPPLTATPPPLHNVFAYSAERVADFDLRIKVAREKAQVMRIRLRRLRKRFICHRITYFPAQAAEDDLRMADVSLLTTSHMTRVVASTWAELVDKDPLQMSACEYTALAHCKTIRAAEEWLEMLRERRDKLVRARETRRLDAIEFSDEDDDNDEEDGWISGGENLPHARAGEEEEEEEEEEQAEQENDMPVIMNGHTEHLRQ